VRDKVLSVICLERLKKATKILSEDSWQLDRNYNWTLLEHKSRMTPLHNLFYISNADLEPKRPSLPPPPSGTISILLTCSEAISASNAGEHNEIKSTCRA
jgi:hypothetical protein